MIHVGSALLLLLVQGADVLLGYNLDVSPERIFSVSGSRFFGYQVRQINSTNGERILAGDPDLGQLRSCDVISGTCEVIALPDPTNHSHMGLTLEVEPRSGRSIVCGSGTQECHQMLYTNGLCYTLSPSLTPSQGLLPGYQECKKLEVDLCFLFDGSGSSGPQELKFIQGFLTDAIRNLKNTTMHLAIVQFSSKFRTELDFSQYQTFQNLTRVIHHLTLLDGGTRIFGGINYTLNHIFTADGGNRPKAKKVLLILTDGDDTRAKEHEKRDIIERADRMGVKRYLIGIGKNFGTDQTRYLMKQLPSPPHDHHTRVLETFRELKNLFVDLQQKILEIEGVKTCAGGVCNASAQGTGFTQELSSAGLSAATKEDWWLLGDPGVFDWSGGILNVSEPEKTMDIPLGEEDEHGYLGYSVGVLETPEGVRYVAGAPRHQYVGMVAVFQETAHGAEWVQNIFGTQVGSYFGSEIEVGDIDQDGLSDVVLIAAPHFYDLRWSGQVSVYHYSEGGLHLQQSLHGVSGHLHSQFGAAVSVLGDLDGDGLGEVAVGAPYEVEGRGAVYIYRGAPGGVVPEYVQRLVGPPGRSSFGLSVHGVLDMTSDGLTDVAVGSASSVVLYRSQPLLNVTVTMRSIPPEIPLPTMEGASCDIGVTLQICVDPQIQTHQYTGPLNVSLEYTATLDSGRSASRMSFTSSHRETMKNVTLLGAHETCWNHSVSLADCFMEDSSPVSVSLAVSQIPDVSPWLVSPSSCLSHTTQIPFQLCGSGGSCKPDFHLESVMDKLVVEEGGSFSVFLRIQNKGDNAQRVKLWATYPPGLSFRKANITEASRRISVLCDDSETQNLICNISHPIMRRSSWARIHVMFGIVSNISWPDEVRLTFNVSSENVTTVVTKNLPVLHPINIITRRVENSTKHVQFNYSDQQRIVTHVYQIQNLGGGLLNTTFNVTVMTLPVEKDHLTWDYRVMSWVYGGICVQEEPSPAPSPSGNQTFVCTMKQHGTITIHVTGKMRPMGSWEGTKSVSTALTVGYDERRYHSQLGQKFHHVEVMTQVEVLPNNVWYIVGGAVGGAFVLLLLCFLLYKFGFFKRYKDRMEEEDVTFTAVMQEAMGHEEEETDDKEKDDDEEKEEDEEKEDDDKEKHEEEKDDDKEKHDDEKRMMMKA